MHSCKVKFEDFASIDNIKRCTYKALKGKKDRYDVERVICNIDEFALIIQDYVCDFYNFPHKPKIIKDGSSGKERKIIVPDLMEHVVHHMVVDALREVLSRGMIDHTYSSIPKRGLHQCAKKVKAWTQHGGKDVKYYLKLDIRKFFDSIDTDVLSKRLGKKIKDPDIRNIVNTILDATDRGIPIGFYTSHWFANWLLEPLDHIIEEKLDISHYARYMDDMILFSSNKRRLEEAKEVIAEWLRDAGLELKPGSKVERFDYIKHNEHHGKKLDFVGFVFYRNKVHLRKSTMLRITRKARKIKKKGKFTIHDARQLMSWLGWIEWADAYRIYADFVAPHVTIKECKRYISQYDKIQRELDKKLKEAC